METQTYDIYTVGHLGAKELLCSIGSKNVPFVGDFIEWEGQEYEIFGRYWVGKGLAFLVYGKD